MKLGDRVSQGSMILVLDAAEGAAAPAEAASSPAAPASAEARRLRRRLPAPAAHARRRASARCQPARGAGDRRARAPDADLHAEVLVLGAGPGGYTAAFRAADLGKKVVLVERYPRSAASA